jgi:hypothetical protein
MGWIMIALRSLASIAPGLWYNIFIQDERYPWYRRLSDCERGLSMNRLKYLRVVNIIIALLVLSLLVSAMTRKLFPALIPYQTFSLMHPLIGFTFVLFICLHIFLNFNWIKANYLKKKK